MAAIIFDFDGTIVNNRDYFVEFLAKEADRWPLTSDDRKMLVGLDLISMARKLGIRWFKLPTVYFKGRKNMANELSGFEVYQGMTELIKKLHKEGHVLFIVSYNSLRNIRLFLKHKDLNHYFFEVYAGISVFGKAGMFNKLLRENNLKNKQVVAVGDETKDILAAKATKIRSVAVTWGLSSAEDLLKLQPTAIANNIAELTKILEEV